MKNNYMCYISFLQVTFCSYRKSTENQWKENTCLQPNNTPSVHWVTCSSPRKGHTSILFAHFSVLDNFLMSSVPSIIWGKKAGLSLVRSAMTTERTKKKGKVKAEVPWVGTGDHPPSNNVWQLNSQHPASRTFLSATQTLQTATQTPLRNSQHSQTTEVYFTTVQDAEEILSWFCSLQPKPKVTRLLLSLTMRVTDQNTAFLQRNYGCPRTSIKRCFHTGWLGRAQSEALKRRSSLRLMRGQGCFVEHHKGISH